MTRLIGPPCKPSSRREPNVGFPMIRLRRPHQTLGHTRLLKFYETFRDYQYYQSLQLYNTPHPCQSEWVYPPEFHHSTLIPKSNK